MLLNRKDDDPQAGCSTFAALAKLARARLYLVLTLSFCLVVLSCCESPEQKKKERLELFDKFVTGVAMHLLDRNPDTIRESINHLQREELPGPVFERLQNEGVLPMTDLSVLKIIDEAQDHHTTNMVKVVSVKPLGPVERDVVPFQVAGQVIDKQEGKADRVTPFNCKITCRLDESTGGWPQAVEVSGLEPHAKSLAAEEKKPPVKRKRRR